MQSVETRVTALLEPEAESHGLELVAVEVAGGHGTVVRVYLDREGGIDLDVITQANRWIADLLEEHTPVKGAYTLEVSSPGIERPLVKLADFERFSGSEVHVKTTGPVDGQSRFTGTISGVEGDIVVLTAEDKTYRLPHGSIARARLKVDIDFG